MQMCIIAIHINKSGSFLYFNFFLSHFSEELGSKRLTHCCWCKVLTPKNPELGWVLSVYNGIMGLTVELDVSFSETLWMSWFLSHLSSWPFCPFLSHWEHAQFIAGPYCEHYLAWRVPQQCPEGLLAPFSAIRTPSWEWLKLACLFEPRVWLSKSKQHPTLLYPRNPPQSLAASCTPDPWC